MPITAKLIMGTGIAAAALFAGSGIASAAPDVEAIVNSTCSYPQVMAALNAQSPEAASQLSSSPAATGWLQNLVAAPPPARRAMVAQIQGLPGVAEYTGLINSVAGSCSNY
ncbi:hemophore-related protein [soil metagenome]